LATSTASGCFDSGLHKPKRRQLLRTYASLRKAESPKKHLNFGVDLLYSYKFFQPFLHNAYTLGYNKNVNYDKNTNPI
jgi:hypothetical protein